MIKVREPVTKPVTKRPHVTKYEAAQLGDLGRMIEACGPEDALIRMSLEAMAGKIRAGRPRKHPTAAAKQKAYRERKRAHNARAG